MIIEFRVTDIAFVLVFIIIDVIALDVFEKKKYKNMFDFLRVYSEIKESEKTQLSNRFFSIFFLLINLLKQKSIMPFYYCEITKIIILSRFIFT